MQEGSLTVTDWGDAARLEPSFFDRAPDQVASDLIGCHLRSERDGVLTGGTIVETEAYLGSDDPGSHASTKGITNRNKVMYGPPGTVYVYFTYGAHFMLNLVCCAAGEAGAVLIRAIEPTEGLEAMRKRRGGVADARLCDGPGKLAQALAVDLSDNGTRLGSHGLWVYDGERVHADKVAVSGRIGLTAGHELDLRYYLKDSPYVSRARTGRKPPNVRRDEEART